MQGTTIETEVHHRDGRPIPVELSYSRWEQDGRMMSCAILRDIRGRKRDEAVLNRLAHTDALTGLPNRVVLTSRMAAALAKRWRFAVLMLIAEGIETEQRAEQLRRNGCLERQGYLDGRPVSAAVFETSFMMRSAPMRRLG